MAALELASRKLYGMDLRFVTEQTPELCMAAVKIDGYALEFIEAQTPEMCLEAVKQKGYALKYVKEQTLEMCLEAAKCSIQSMYLYDIPNLDKIVSEDADENEKRFYLRL
jgi:hypothetical protein